MKIRNDNGMLTDLGRLLKSTFIFDYDDDYRKEGYYFAGHYSYHEFETKLEELIAREIADAVYEEGLK